MGEPSERDLQLCNDLRSSGGPAYWPAIVAGYRVELEAKHAAELAQAKRDLANVSQLRANQDVQLDILRGDLETVRRERDDAVARANHLPGLTATLDEVRWKVGRLQPVLAAMREQEAHYRRHGDESEAEYLQRWIDRIEEALRDP